MKEIGAQKMEEDRPDDRMMDAACGAAEGLPGEDSINQPGQGSQQPPEIKEQLKKPSFPGWPPTPRKELIGGNCKKDRTIRPVPAWPRQQTSLLCIGLNLHF